MRVRRSEQRSPAPCGDDAGLKRASATAAKEPVRGPQRSINLAEETWPIVDYWRVAATINSGTILVAAHAGVACAGLESVSL